MWAASCLPYLAARDVVTVATDSMMNLLDGVYCSFRLFSYSRTPCVGAFLASSGTFKLTLASSLILIS